MKIERPSNVEKESKEFTYQRKFLIKDLFNAKNIFAEFSILEFNSFTAFFSFIEKNLYTISERIEYIIHIKTENELQLIKELILQTKLAEKNMITLDLDSSLIEYAANNLGEDLVNIGIRLETSEIDTLTSYLKTNLEVPMHKFLKTNLLWIDATWSYENYSEEYENIIRTALFNPYAIFLDLKFDYVSFEKAPLEELHKLYFYINQLKGWLTTQEIPRSSDPFNTQKCEDEDNCDGSKYEEEGEVCKCNNNQNGDIKVNITIKNRDAAPRAFIYDNLDISLSSNAPILFEMSKHLDSTGEDIYIIELDTLRQILDVKFKNPGFFNMYLVDISQNIKIMKDPYMIPYITQIIGSWLERGSK